MASDGTALNGFGAATAGLPFVLVFDQFADSDFAFLRT